MATAGAAGFSNKVNQLYTSITAGLQSGTTGKLWHGKTMTVLTGLQASLRDGSALSETSLVKAKAVVSFILSHSSNREAALHNGERSYFTTATKKGEQVACARQILNELDSKLTVEGTSIAELPPEEGMFRFEKRETPFLTSYSSYTGNQAKLTKDLRVVIQQGINDTQRLYDSKPDKLQFNGEASKSAATTVVGKTVDFLKSQLKAEEIQEQYDILKEQLPSTLHTDNAMAGIFLESGALAGETAKQDEMLEMIAHRMLTSTSVADAFTVTDHVFASGLQVRDKQDYEVNIKVSHNPETDEKELSVAFQARVDITHGHTTVYEAVVDAESHIESDEMDVSMDLAKPATEG